MAPPIINVQWEYAGLISNQVKQLAQEVNRQNGRITANQLTLLEIQQQLADGVNAIGGGGGMGWPLFRGALYYRFTLLPGQVTKVVESTPEPALRQVRFRLQSGTGVFLSNNETLMGDDWNPLILNEEMIFQDDHDGGADWYAMAPNGATILIEVRTAEQAEQQGENFVIPLVIEPIIKAKDYDDYGNFLRGSNNTPNSPQSYRCLDIVSFHPGTEYTFTIDVADNFAPWLVDESTHPSSTGQYSRYNRYGSKVIEVYAPNLYENVPELVRASLPDNGSQWGLFKEGGWVASLPKTGGTFKFTPNFSRRHMFFYARVSQYEPGDFGTGFADAVSITYERATKTITLVGF